MLSLAELEALEEEIPEVGVEADSCIV